MSSLLAKTLNFLEIVRRGNFHLSVSNMEPDIENLAKVPQPQKDQW